MEAAFETVLVDIDTLIPHGDNYNEGDVGAIMTAIAIDGWHGAVLAQAPSKRRKRPRIYAGEHRWLALKMLQADGYTYPDGTHRTYEELLADPKILVPPAGQCPVQLLSLADLQAARKLAADNRASSLARPDELRLAQLLRTLDAEDGLLGSLYEGDDLEDMLKSLDAGFGQGNMASARTPADRLDDYLGSTIRSLILPLPAAEYERLVDALDKVQHARDLESHSATVVAVIQEAADALVAQQ